MTTTQSVDAAGLERIAILAQEQPLVFLGAAAAAGAASRTAFRTWKWTRRALRRGDS